jgi:hypothetical protein
VKDSAGETPTGATETVALPKKLLTIADLRPKWWKTAGEGAGWDTRGRVFSPEIGMNP